MMRMMFRKPLLVLLAVALLASGACAATSKASSLARGGKGNAETSLERDIDGGIAITCEGVYLNNGVVEVKYILLPEEDVVVKIAGATDLFDVKGKRLAAPSGDYVLIGKESIGEREIIAGVKTPVTLKYTVPNGYALADSYARMSFSLNGQVLTFRNIPSKTIPVKK